VTLVELALRPGGGDSFSGGGGHSGSSGGGGGGVFELVYWLLRLIFVYPQVGVPILVLLVGYVLYSAYRQHQNRDWDSGPPVALERAIALSDLRQLDPEFSQIVFEDFAFRLFAAAHRARQATGTIAPYVAPAAQIALARREPIGEAVESVVVGAIRVLRVDIPKSPTDDAGRPNRVRIGVEFEANVTTKSHTAYSVESWLFGREAHVKTAARTSKTFPCPNCGAPWKASDTGTQVCASCGKAVDNGRFDWVVEQISLASIDQRPPTLTTDVPERGNDLPTYHQPDIDARFAALRTDDPALSEAALTARLELIYARLNDAWSKNDLVPVRGLVSDGLYDYLAYWTDAYARQQLHNELVDMRITKTELAKLERDKHYDALTIRIFARGKDFVVDASGTVLRGSKHRERPYTEYWTLIRSASRRGAARAEPTCGNCGAPLKITMAGACEFCSAHVTAGEFDWVLSKIEQDDTYRG
jgi:Tim44-like domain